MSHVVTIQTKVHDPAAVAAACQRLNLAAPVQRTTRLYSGEATGRWVPARATLNIPRNI